MGIFQQSRTNRHCILTGTPSCQTLSGLHGWVPHRVLRLTVSLSPLPSTWVGLVLHHIFHLAAWLGQHRLVSLWQLPLETLY